MGLDGFTLRALVAELAPLLSDARLTRIHQPARDEVALILYHQRRDWRLVLSVNPRWARLSLEEVGQDNPPTPPPFCMVLRKHLDGARLVEIAQDGLERVVTLTFAVRDELGDLRRKRLLLEIMGRHSNLVLVDERDTIIDAIRRVADEDAVRPLLPGLPYAPPPRPALPDALTVDRASLAELLRCRHPAADALCHGLFGLSPLLAREICARAGVDPRIPAETLGVAEVDAIYDALAALRCAKSALRPQTVTLADGRREFSAFDLTQFGAAPRRYYGSVNALIADVLGGGERQETVASLKRSLAAVVRRESERCMRKRAAQLEEARRGAEADDLRLVGELILANLHRLGKRMTAATLADYAGNERTVVLDPSLSPSDNAQAYFRRYARAKKAAVAAADQARRTGEELAYLNEVAVAIEQATDIASLNDIRAELAEQGYLRGTGDGRPAKPAPSAPRRFISADGYEILVGRNNMQNDLLTMKLARPNDIWLHAKDIPGAHVILRVGNEPPPFRAIAEAAALAAYYSSARAATKVPVDYTERRHVRKVPGARPGMVIYDRQKTIMVAPQGPAGE